MSLPKTPASVLFASLFALISVPGFAVVATGHVVDPSGNPVTGATVILGGSNYPDTKTVTTDASGNFTQDVGDDSQQGWSHSCFIEMKGYAPTGGALYPKADNIFQLELPIQVKGTVVDANGQPVSGVKVAATFSFHNTGTPQRPETQRDVAYDALPDKDNYSATTDAKGSYTISGLPPDSENTFQLQDPRFAIIRVSTTKGVTTAPPLKAVPGVIITGKVVKQDGSPLADANIQVQSANRNGGIESSSGGKTGDDGTFKITGLPPGAYLVSAGMYNSNSSNSYVPAAAESITASADKPNVVPNFVMTSGGVVNGTIIDAETKQPIPGVQFGIQTAASMNSGGMNIVSVSGKTDDQGHFSLHVFPGNDILFVYQAPNAYVVNQGQEQHTFSVTDGGSTTMDPILLAKGLSFTGKLVDGGGSPMPGVSVTLRSNESNVYYNIEPATSDASGQFTVNKLTPGSYSIDPGTGYEAEQPKAVTVPSSDVPTIVVNKVASASVTGSVVDSAGKPVSGVSVSVEVLHKVSNGTMYGDNKQATSGDDGSFTLTALPTGDGMTQGVTYQKDGWIVRKGGELTSKNGVLTMATTVMAELGGSVEGIVRNGLDKPVAGAWVSSPESGPTATPVATDATGNFKLTGLAVGQIDIYAAKGNYMAHKYLTASKTPTPTTITLDAAPAQPTAPDLEGAKSLYHDLQNSDGTDSVYFVRDQTGAQLGLVDKDAGVAFIQGETPMNTCDFGVILSAILPHDPEGIAQWALPITQQVPNYQDWRARDYTELGLAAAPVDRKLASQYFDLANKEVDMTSLDDQSIQLAMSLAALAYAVGSPKADAIYQTVDTAMKSIASNSKNSQNADYDTRWLVMNMAEVLAQGNLQLAEKLIDGVADENTRDNGITQTIQNLVNYDPSRAVDFFNHYNNADKPMESWTYGRSVALLIPTIYKTNPDQALALAQKDGEGSTEAQALTEVADLMPLDKATPLYKQAEDKTELNYNQGYSPACVAAHAWVRDKVLGAELYKAAYDKVMGAPQTNQYGQQPFYAEFAFYYARFDPAYARLLLESRFEIDNLNSQNSYPNSSGADAIAMCAIDVTRAKQMAQAIKHANQYNTFTSLMRIDQYVMASPVLRNQIDFDSWTNERRELYAGETKAW